MGYADPQSVTVNSVPISLPRTGTGPTSGQFTASDGSFRLDVSHNYGRRVRRTIRLTQSKISADVLIPSQNVNNTMSVYLVVNSPLNGFTVVEAKHVVDALIAHLSASTGANITKLLGGEV